MTKNMALINKAGVKNPESIMPNDARLSFTANIDIALDRNVPDAKMTSLSGTYLSYVFEGDY